MKAPSGSASEKRVSDLPNRLMLKKDENESHCCNSIICKVILKGLGKGLKARHPAYIYSKFDNHQLIWYYNQKTWLIMLENLFGNSVIEKILFFLLLNEKTYASELSRVFEISLFSFQTALERLEKGGILVSYKEGKTRLYQLNPRFPMLKELVLFLKKAYTFLPESFCRKYYERPIRKRPRRKGKPL